MFKLGLCCGGSACCLLAGALWMGGGLAVEPASDTAVETETQSAGCAKVKSDVQLTDFEDKVVAPSATRAATSACATRSRDPGRSRIRCRSTSAGRARVSPCRWRPTR